MIGCELVIAESEDDLTKRLSEWKYNVENRGMRANVKKIKVMINGEHRNLCRKKAARRPCDVCNSVQWTICQEWVLKKCIGIKVSISKVINKVIYV